MGHFKKKDRKCFDCGSQWIGQEEKETDVSIGITLLNEAYKDRFSRAYLVTRDSDLMPCRENGTHRISEERDNNSRPAAHGPFSRSAQSL